MKADRQSCCLEDRAPKIGLPSSMADTTMLWTVKPQLCQTIRGILSSCRPGRPSSPTLGVK